MKRGSLVLALALLGLSACGSAASTGHQWQTVHSFTGKPGDTSPTFTIPAGARISYDVVTTGSIGSDAYFGIMAQHADGSDWQLLAGKVGIQAPDEVTGTATLPAGTMQLAVTGNGVNVQIEVQT